jgi:hypothetical protein
MAEEITASSMGQAIGLGYRTKDIGPQLMQFQAGELARRSAEKNAAKREKKADYDKIMDKFFTIGTGKTHTSIQKEFNAANDKTKKEVETALMNDDRDTAMQLIYEAAQRSNYYADRTKNYDGIEEAYRTGSKIVPEDVVNSIKGDKFTGVDGNQMTFLNALGYQYDDKTQQYIAQGFDKKNTLEELRSIPKPTKEMFDQYKVGPKFSEEQARAGYYKKGTEVYVPTDAMFLDVVKQKVQDPSFVANEVNRIAQNNSKTYVQLATATQAEMVEKNKLAGVDKPITGEEVNRQMVINDLTLNHKDQWIKEHTIGEDRNPIPAGGGKGKSDKDEVPPNPADIIGSEHINNKLRKLINERQPSFKNKPDSDILKMIQNPKTDQEKAVAKMFQAVTSKGKLATVNYPGVMVSEANDNFTIPSNGKTVAITEIFYNTDDNQFYLTSQKTAGKLGVTEKIMPGQFPLTEKDLNAMKSRASGGNAALKDALAKLNANAESQGYPTIDAWINGKKGGGTRSANTTPTSGGRQKINGW